MIIKINKQLRDEVGSKCVLAKTISDHVGVSIKDAKEIVDSLDGDQMYVIPEELTGEEREILFSILREKGLCPEYVKDEDVIDFEDEDDDPDRIGAYIEATEVGTVVTVRLRIDKEIAPQLVGLLKDAGMASAKKEPSTTEPERADIVSVANNFGLGEVCAYTIQTYIRDVLRFKNAVEIEYRLRKAIDQIGIKHTLEEYKKSL